VFCLFLVFRNAIEPDEARLRSTAMRKAHVYTPERADDPFLNDGAPPPLALQLYFDTLPALESACDLLDYGKNAVAQAMAVRPFPVPNPGTPKCTYLVAYDGPAEDEHAWHAHYLAHHPPLMARLPGILELEVYTRVDWVAPAGWQRANCMQRNKVSFDSPAALSAALDSPERRAMRADYNRLPRFAGAVTHYPMSTRVVVS
jgi:uncharacterized protein (TIGR02118 family)